ncbi:MAG: acetate--CoA ligase family protein [Proteobacteria bacterium]|nr:acetate--CoA ligase family protein [Pseudomonadota bacterium]
MHGREAASLDCFFRPRSIAVVGASRTPGRAGYVLVENLKSGFGGEVYPINAQADEIAGLMAYRSVGDVPGELDLAVLLVPAGSVPEAVRDCAEKRVKGVIVEASDFAEVGAEGRERQDEIVRIARDSGMRLWGPNCMGVIDTRSRVVTTYAPLRDVRPGNVSLVTQSGSMAGAILLQVHENRTFSFNKICSIGNKADVDETDLLDYLGDDPHTKVVAMYLESIGDGRRFYELATRVSPRKPIVVLKSGRTAMGVSASMTHTASLTGDDRVAQAVFAEAGIVRADDVGDFLLLLKAFDGLHARTAGRRVAIVSTTGAGGVMASDQLGLHGLSMASLSPPTMERIYQEFPRWLKPDQPLDISPTMMKIGPNRALQHAVSAVLDDANVDALLLLTYGMPSTAAFDPGALAGIVARSNKAAVAWLYGLRQYLDPWARALEEGGVPVMPDLRSAAGALSALAGWSERKARPVAPTRGAAPKARPVSAARGRPPLGGSSPSLAQAFALLSEYGIAVAHGETAAGAEEAVRAAARIGYPVALKAADPRLTHRSDVGAVKLNLADAEAVRAAVGAVERAIPGQLSRAVHVQEMIGPGLEVIVGGWRDPQFGPVVVCGLGGIWVELLKDVAMRVTPASEATIRAMIRELRAFPLLDGFRGQPAYDQEALVRTVSAVGWIMNDHPEIRSLDVNPVILLPEGKGGVAVDVAVHLVGASAAT